MSNRQRTLVYYLALLEDDFEFDWNRPDLDKWLIGIISLDLAAIKVEYSD